MGGVSFSYAATEEVGRYKVRSMLRKAITDALIEMKKLRVAYGLGAKEIDAVFVLAWPSLGTFKKQHVCAL